MSVKKMTQLSLYTVIALTISTAESFIPPPVPLPGIKLGLANIITLLLLNRYRAGEIFLVLFIRILLSALVAGGAMSLLYSLTGGILCFLITVAVNRFLCGKFLFLTGICGALAHNIGQILVAYFLTGTKEVFLYTPVLMISGAITGLFTGLSAHYAQKYLMMHKNCRP